MSNKKGSNKVYCYDDTNSDKDNLDMVVTAGTTTVATTTATSTTAAMATVVVANSGSDRDATTTEDNNKDTNSDKDNLEDNVDKDEDKDQWEVVRLITPNEKKVECGSDECSDPAVATWSPISDPDFKFDLCKNCQDEHMIDKTDSNYNFRAEEEQEEDDNDNDSDSEGDHGDLYTSFTTTTTTTTAALTASATTAATTTEVNELWDVVVGVIPTDEEKVECRTEGCTDQAVATWTSKIDPDFKFDLCKNCQDEHMGDTTDSNYNFRAEEEPEEDNRVNDDDSDSKVDANYEKLVEGEATHTVITKYPKKYLF